METPPDYQGEDALPQESVDGQRLMGRAISIHRRVQTFAPQAWHKTCDWQGDRFVITAFVSRSHSHMGDEMQQELSQLGFGVPELPTYEPERGYVVQRLGQWQRRLNADPQREDERIKRQLYLLHAATGHGSTRHMIDALRRRGASERVLTLAREFKCAACQEKQRVGHRHMASLQPLPPKWSAISADVGHWYHETRQEHVQFMLVIDEGSRFRIARILTQGSKQQPGAVMCLEYLQEGWMQYFGKPDTLRLDPPVPSEVKPWRVFVIVTGFFLM